MKEGELDEKICWKCGDSFSDELEVCPNDGARLLELTVDDRKDPLVGQLFDGRFRILRKLGEGGMGTVYSAKQIDFEREVAIKILKIDFLRDENIRKRFMYEARTISNLEHPNAVRLYDFGQTPEGSFYMVMELLRGESLADRLAYRFLTYREILDIVPPVCGVLGEAHINDVVHRDLKPENIYLSQVAGNREFPKLLDFGIAKHLRDETMTKSGTLWGTPAYMSPEQAKGDQVGAAADIYAIGIILYELICGNLPFHATTQMGLAMKHISVPARPLSSIPGLESVPEPLDDLVLNALQKDVEARPADMAKFADELREIRRDCFDEELLETIPAQEVDAIALQEWIEDEPDVEEDHHGEEIDEEFFDGSETARAPVIDSVTVEADAVESGEHPTGDVGLDGTAEIAVPSEVDASASLSHDELLAARASHPRRMIVGGLVILALIIGGVVAVVSSTDDADSASATAVIPGSGDETSGAAGAGASAAAIVIVNARNSAVEMKPDFIVVDGVEMVGEDVESRPAEEPAKKIEDEEGEAINDVKSALEKTF